MTSPRALALAYDRYAAALWRGDDAQARTFATWLEGYWADEGPAETPDSPHAVSLLGGAGAGIRWYTRGRTVVGYAGNRPRGCYEVPVDASPPLIDLLCETEQTASQRSASRSMDLPGALACGADPVHGAPAWDKPDRGTIAQTLRAS